MSLSKRSINRTIGFLAGTIFCFPAMLPAQSFGPEIHDCHEYTARATDQVHMGKGCGFTGPRWSDNSNDHYNWCLGATPAARGSEDQQRKFDLVNCRTYASGLYLSFHDCNLYGWRAMSQVEIAKLVAQRSSCTFAGPRWSDKFDDHVNWCNAVKSSGAPWLEYAARRTALAECQVRPPSPSEPVK